MEKIHDNTRSPTALCLLLSILALCLSYFVASGQSFPIAIKLKDDQGLLQNTIRSIVQDGQGFMYFGTEIGLSRFDGYDFQNFRSQIETSQSNPTGALVRALRLLSNQQLIFGTLKGICTYNCISGNFPRFLNTVEAFELIDNQARAIEVDSITNTIWVGTENGLMYINRDSLVTKNSSAKLRVPVRDNIDRGKINSIARSKDLLWVGTENGLWAFFPNSGTYAQQPVSGTEHITISFLFTEPQSRRLWAGTSDKKLMSLENQRWRAVDSLERPIRTILDDGTYLWVGTSGELLRYEIAALQNGNLSKTQVLGHLDVVTTYLDKRNNLIWVGTAGDGVLAVSTVNSQGIRSWGHDASTSTSLGSENVASAFQSNDSRGFVWVGLNGGGLDRIDPATGAISHYDQTSTPKLPKLKVFSILEDADRQLWIGTSGGGLFLCQRNDDGDITAFQKLDNNSFGNYQVKSLCDPGFGKIWIAVYGKGLFWLDKGTREIQAYKTPDPKDQEALTNAYTLYQSPKDPTHMYLGTVGGGFFMIDLKDNSKSWHRAAKYHGSQSDLLDNQVVAFEQDRKYPWILWLGTASSGILAFDEKSDSVLASFNSDKIEDFPDNSILGLKQDEHGNLWFSTNSGLAVLDPIKARVIQRFTKDDGLDITEFNGGASYRNPVTGTMFFGGVGGLCMLNPSALEQDSSCTSVPILSSIHYNEKFYGPGDKMYDDFVLPLGMSLVNKLQFEAPASFTLTFTPMAFARPRNLRMEYALVARGNTPKESDWEKFSKIQENNGAQVIRNTIEFIQLEAGDYDLYVRTVNVYTNLPVATRPPIELVLITPWSKKPISYILGVAAFFLAIGYGFFNRRKRVLAEKDLEIHEERRKSELALDEVAIAQEKVQQLQKIIEASQERIASLGKTKRELSKELEGVQNVVKDKSAEKEQLEKNVEKRTKQLSSLNRITQKLTTTLDLDASLEDVFNALYESMPINTLAIGRLSEDKRFIHYDWNIERQDDESLMKIPSFSRLNNDKESVGGRCVRREKQGETNPEVNWEILHESNRDIRTIRPDKAVSLLGVCMVVEGEIIGVVIIKSYKRHLFKDDEVSMLRSVATTFGVALKSVELNKRLKAETNSRVALANSLGHDIRHLFGLIGSSWTFEPGKMFEMDGQLQTAADGTSDRKIGKLTLFPGYESLQNSIGFVPFLPFTRTFAKLGSIWTGRFPDDIMTVDGRQPVTLREAVQAAFSFAKEVGCLSVLNMHGLQHREQLLQIAELHSALMRIYPSEQIIALHEVELKLDWLNGQENEKYEIFLMRLLYTLAMNTIKHCNPAGEVLVTFDTVPKSQRIQLSISNELWAKDNSKDPLAIQAATERLLNAGRVGHETKGLVNSIWLARGKFKTGDDFMSANEPKGEVWKTRATLQSLLDGALRGRIISSGLLNDGDDVKPRWRTIVEISLPVAGNKDA